MKQGSTKVFRIAFAIMALGMIASCSQHGYPALGDGYRFDTGDGNSLVIVNSENAVLISDLILDYAFDSTYIILSQRPWDDPNIPRLREMSYNQRSTAFEESTFRQFWIIDKKQKGERSLDTVSMSARYSNVYGPFDKQEYLRKRDELGVPKELILNEQQR